MPKTNAIRAALEQHLLDTFILLNDPVLDWWDFFSSDLPPAAFNNVAFDQTTVPNGRYIQAQFAPISRRPATRGPNPQYRHSGVFLITVCTPENIGAGEGLVLVDALLDRFRVDTPILGVDVNVTIEYSEPETGYQRPPFFCQPVRIGWYCYA